MPAGIYRQHMIRLSYHEEIMPILVILASWLVWVCFHTRSCPVRRLPRRPLLAALSPFRSTCRTEEAHASVDFQGAVSSGNMLRTGHRRLQSLVGQTPAVEEHAALSMERLASSRCAGPSSLGGAAAAAVASGGALAVGVPRALALAASSPGIGIIGRVLDGKVWLTSSGRS